MGSSSLPPLDNTDKPENKDSIRTFGTEAPVEETPQTPQVPQKNESGVPQMEEKKAPETDPFTSGPEKPEVKKSGDGGGLLSAFTSYGAMKILLILSFVFLGLIMVVYGVLYAMDDGGGVNDVKVTNLTANGATISWTTNEESIGKVYYSKGGSWIPLFEKLGKEVTFDDRDLEENEEAEFVIKAGGVEKRYTHHVTLRGLEPETEYSFRVSGDVKPIAGEVTTFTTFTPSEDVRVPDPVYGKVIYKESNDTPKEGIVYYQVQKSETDEAMSRWYSTTINSSGGYSGDIGYLLTDEGEVLTADENSYIFLYVRTDKSSTSTAFDLDEYKPLPYIQLENLISNDDEETSSGIFNRQLSNTFSMIKALESSLIKSVSASGGSCEGESGDCPAVGGWINCGGRSESNCNAVQSTCGLCSWVGGATEPPTIPPSSGGGGTPPPPPPPSGSGTPGSCVESLAAGEGKPCGTPGAIGSCICTCGGQSYTGGNKCTCNDVCANVSNPLPAPPPQEQQGAVGGGTFNINQSCAILFQQLNSPCGNTSASEVSHTTASKTCSYTVGGTNVTVEFLPNGHVVHNNASALTNCGSSGGSAGGGETPPAGGSSCAGRCQSALGYLCPQGGVGVVGESITGANAVVVCELSGLTPGGAGARSTWTANIRCSDGALVGGNFTPPAYCTSNSWTDDQQESYVESVGLDPNCPSKTIDCGGGDVFSPSDVRGPSVSGDKYTCNYTFTRYESHSGGQLTVEAVYTKYLGEAVGESFNFVSGSQADFCGQNYGNLPQNNLDSSILSNVKAQDDTPNIVDSGVYEISAEGFETTTIVITEDNVILDFFVDTNGDGIRQNDEPTVEGAGLELNLSKKNEAVNYEFVAGWNLFGFELVSESWSNASTLIREINKQGVEATHVAGYGDGKWQMYSLRKDDDGNDVTYGEDFTIIPGKGYFIKTLVSSSIKLTGKTFLDPVPIDFDNGWNLISVQGPDLDYTAESFINKCESEGIMTDTVSRFDSGLYESVVKDEGVIFGNNFNLVQKRGYFVRVESGGGQRLTP